MQGGHLPQAIILKALTIQRGIFYVVSVKTLKLLLSLKFMDGEGNPTYELLVEITGVMRDGTGNFAVINTCRKEHFHSCLPLHLNLKGLHY